MLRIGLQMAIKECYFTSQNLEQQALRLFEHAKSFYRDKSIAYVPQDSALLVLDMQEYFLDPASHAYIPSAEAIIPGVIQLIEAYAAHGRPIIYSQHINTESDAGMMSTWWKDMITAGNEFHPIIPIIDITTGQLVQKSQYDAFYQTQLEAILREKGVKQVVICGVMTHLCCETTARSAFMRGYEVFFPVDGTATYNLEFHRSSLTNLAHGFAVLVLMKDLLKVLRGEHGH